MSVIQKLKELLTNQKEEKEEKEEKVELQKCVGVKTVNYVHEVVISPVECGDKVYLPLYHKPTSFSQYLEFEVFHVDEDEHTFQAKHEPRIGIENRYITVSMATMRLISYMSDAVYSRDLMIDGQPDTVLVKHEYLSALRDRYQNFPIVGDTRVAKLYYPDRDTYGEKTETYKILGIIEEAYSAAPIGDKGVIEERTAIFDIHTHKEIKEDKSLYYTITFPDVSEAHTSYLYKKINKMKEER
ncbi:hypothetical protein FP73_gp005 [Bacillus phage Hoody T]|uniref:Uncharacterized protein n=1 Tax=Bacillus phage Hoody T TaxID=1486660 RepID=A0A024B1R6_9CAUD|nr:hypothetical protein FP73_gp005 [Bacillus phage Hoody T]AHZ10317.1 hypothetical protein [Bacillus phage Hoody T]